jgi:hypothetical protein
MWGVAFPACVVFSFFHFLLGTNSSQDVMMFVLHREGTLLFV